MRVCGVLVCQMCQGKVSLRGSKTRSSCPAPLCPWKATDSCRNKLSGQERAAGGRIFSSRRPIDHLQSRHVSLSVAHFVLSLITMVIVFSVFSCFCGILLRSFNVLASHFLAVSPLHCFVLGGFPSCSGLLFPHWLLLCLRLGFNSCMWSGLA